jgi:pimeloyl-ACP methyl ester carboxylesterase
MHAAKVILLVLLTLAAMRVTSWSLGWLLKRHSKTRTIRIALVSNFVALALFTGLLLTQRIPGELLDISELAFGVLVFTIFALYDVKWSKWGDRWNRTLLVIALLWSWPLGNAKAESKQDTAIRKQAKVLPVAGELFFVNGHEAFLIMPEHAAANSKTAWVWYAPTLPGLPGKEEKWMFQKFLDAGMAIAGIDVGESYGSPDGRALFSALYKELVKKRGLCSRPCLLARSRGGLMLYNWAVEHSSSVACIAGIYPVCNLCSYPGLEKACGAYAMTAEQLEQKLSEHNPIDRLPPLAQAHVPVFHIHGDSDVVVPLAENSGELAERYKKLGGEIILKVVNGQGHNMWPGWFECQELVDFVISHKCKK